MRIFVSEFTVGGASMGMDFPESMRQEGRAMLQAVTADISRMPDCTVVTTLEQNLNCSLNAEVIRIENVNREHAVFQQLLAEVDGVLVIAPETNGILAERCRWVVEAGVHSWNCSPAAIELCSDKLRLANHLYWHGLPIIPTQQIDLSKAPDITSWPVVLKPRDGAGSNLTFLISDSRDWDQAVRRIYEAGNAGKMIVQPFIRGQALSIGVNRTFDGSDTECLPVGLQRLSDDGLFRYLGGIIPADISPDLICLIHEMVGIAALSIPGLAGYFGMDLLLTEDFRPLIVEMNPRLTTSYIGYRQLFDGVLPERWFSMSNSPRFVSGRPGFIEFEMSKC